MATTLSCFRTPTIRASSGNRKPDPNRRKAPSSSSSNWWTPIFNWPSDPDYISTNDPPKKQLESSDPVPEPDRPRSRFAPGCFTEDKAKQLRRKTAETSAFHDIMYHSAIASRLASDISERDDV